MEALTITVEFLSDWQIGVGAGRRGEADRLAARDENGLPYIPGKTLTGILRDASESVAAGLDEGKRGPWTLFTDTLFGTQPVWEAKNNRHAKKPRKAGLSISAAHFPDVLATLLGHDDNRACKDALFFLKPGIAVDTASGVAEEKSLRFDEVVRGGCILQAAAQLQLEDEYHESALALLWAATRKIERMGAKRRRGLGRCKLRITGLENQEELLSALNKDPLIRPTNDDKTVSGYMDRQTGVWCRIDLQVTAKQPLVIPQRTLGNVVRGRSEIPGHYLLGPVTRALSGISNINLYPHVAAGNLQILNAVTEVDGERGLPVPFALFHDKENEGLEQGKPVVNRLRKAVDNHDVQYKGHRQGFVPASAIANNNYPGLATVPLEVRTHNAVDDEPQRPTEDVGGVYSYEAIPKGTILRSELRLSKTLADELVAKDANWRQKINSTARVGISKKDDYGKVKIKALSRTEKTQEASAENTTQTDTQADQLTVWLLSDLLLRDQRLRPCADPTQLTKTLQHELGLKHELGEKLELRQKDKLLSLTARPRRSEGWHVKWCRPRQSLTGLAGGSCFVFEVTGKLDAAKLRRLEQEGLGDRRAEGFGQLCFNPPLLQAPSLTKSGPTTSGARKENATPAPPKLNNATDQQILRYARLLEREAWRHAILRSAQAVAAVRNRRRKILGFEHTKPKNSQLGALRMRVMQVQDEATTKKVSDWLGTLKKDKWPPATVEKLQKLLADEKLVTDLLVVEQAPPILTAEGQQSLQKELRPLAVRAIVGAAVQAEIRDRENPRADEDHPVPAVREEA